MKGTGAKRNVCPGSCVSTGAKFPVAPVESAPMGGRGNSGSADCLQVWVVTLGYPSGLADPLDSDVARAADVLITADATSITSTTGSTQILSPQPPTVADTTAAASRSPTHAQWPRMHFQCQPTGNVITHNARTDRRRVFILGGKVGHVTRHV